MSQQAAQQEAVDHVDRFLLRFQSLGFGIGSLGFALGTVLVWLQGSEIAVNVTYALGACFFTAAAGGQWEAARRHRPKHDTARRQARADLTDPDWMASAVQFVGTLFFNVMTIRAVLLSLGAPDQSYEAVWVPDVFGSALFLVSSWIAWHPIARHRRHRLLAGRSQWICWNNMIGSLFFGLSAWGAALLPSGELRSEAWGNWGTFLGALAFLAAAVLLWPGRTPAPPAESR